MNTNSPCGDRFALSRLAVAAAGLLLLATATTSLAADPAPAAAAGHAGPRLSIDASSHDFGTVSQGEALNHDFKVSNSGDRVLEITDVRPACGCTTAGDWPHALQPGESGVIPVRLDTTHFVGPLTKTIDLKSNDPMHPQTVLQLAATVWTPISILKPVLVLPAVTDPSEAGTRSTTIRNETDTPLTLALARTDNPVFKPELKTVVPGKEYELTVTTVPPLPEGTQTGRIFLKTSNGARPEISVEAVVTVLPALQLAPSQIVISTPRLSAAEKRFAVVLNHRKFDLHVSDVTTNAPGVQLATTTSEDKKQTTVALTFPAGFAFPPGEKLYLRGKTDHPALPAFEIPIVYAGSH